MTREFSSDLTKNSQIPHIAQQYDNIFIAFRLFIIGHFFHLINNLILLVYIDVPDVGGRSYTQKHETRPSENTHHWRRHMKKGENTKFYSWPWSQDGFSIISHPTCTLASDHDALHQEVRSPAPPPESKLGNGLMWPTEHRSDSAHFGAQALRASTFPAWNIPCWKPAARSKGHHAMRKPKLPSGENRHVEDHLGTAMRWSLLGQDPPLQNEAKWASRSAPRWTEEQPGKALAEFLAHESWAD